MNQQNQGSGSLTPSNLPVKRKRGRPRKEESAVWGDNKPVMAGSDNVLNCNQTAGTTDDCDEEMVGRVVTGVIEGTFNAGYLLNVKVADSDTYLRGLVFLPGRVTPVTAENDVAPDIRMVERKEIPVPILSPQAHIHGFVPASGQCSKQTFEPELQVPMPEDQVPPTELHSGISVSHENQSASIMVPMADLPKNVTSISTAGMPQGIPEPGNKNQSASITPEVECGETVKQDEALHDVDASRQVKESSVDGGTTKDSEPASKPINLVPTIEDTDKELGTGQQAVPAVHKRNELIVDEPNTSNIEFNQITVFAQPESMPPEQISTSNFVEKQAFPKTDVLEDTKTELATETSSKVDSSNSDGRPNTGVTNILDVGLKQALETSQREAVPSESKFSSEGSDFIEKGDPPTCSSPGAVDKVNVDQPADSLVGSVESENPVGSDNS